MEPRTIFNRAICFGTESSRNGFDGLFEPYNIVNNSRREQIDNRFW